ncbi:MAG: yidC [Chlamydiales bacterium]|nr:yidC [Chlamydiales bacterium]
MDRRSLAFFIIVFFGITASNLYFSQLEHERRAEWVKNVAEQEAKKKQQMEEDVAARKAPSKALPIAELYLDQEGKEAAGFGLEAGDCVLVAGDAPFEEQLYYRPLNSKKTPTPLFLADRTSHSLAAFYVTNPDKKRLKKGALPDIGSFDMQLIARRGSLKEVHHLAEWVDGSFSIPFLAPSENAVAVAKVGDEYLPIGIYSDSTNEFYLLDSAEGQIAIETARAQQTLTQPHEERFYILENEYQQLVFSSKGASLVEINLPFKEEGHAKRAVLPIEFDQKLREEAKPFATFPAKPAFRFNGQEMALEKGKVGGYYPLLRREVKAPKGTVPFEIEPRFQALNVVSDYDLASLPYELKEFDSEHIVFEASQPHRRIRKTFYLDQSGKEAPYCFYATLQVEGDRRNLWVTSGVLEVEWISNAPAPQLNYRVTQPKGAKVEKIDLPKDMATNGSIEPDWVATSNGFFGIILDPLTDMSPGFKAECVPGAEVPSRLVQVDHRHERFKVNDLPGYQLLLPIHGKAKETRLRVFAGPYAEDVLKAADKTYLDPKTGQTPDYQSCQSFHGWFAFISAPIPFKKGIKKTRKRRKLRS